MRWRTSLFKYKEFPYSALALQISVLSRRRKRFHTLSSPPRSKYCRHPSRPEHWNSLPPLPRLRLRPVLTKDQTMHTHTHTHTHTHHTPQHYSNTQNKKRTARTPHTTEKKNRTRQTTPRQHDHQDLDQVQDKCHPQRHLHRHANTMHRTTQNRTETPIDQTNIDLAMRTQ